MRHPGLRAAIVAAGLVAQPLSSLQQEDGGFRLKTVTRVVEINVSVQDAEGKPVSGLQQSDFTITDDGKPRAFTIFRDNTALVDTANTGSRVPLPVVPRLPPNTFTNMGVPQARPTEHSTIILLDGINGWFDNFATARKAVIGMLNSAPRDERIALYVISKNEGLLILQDYTLDRELLLKAITEYIPHAMCAAPPGFEAGEGMRDPITIPAPPPPADTDSAEASRIRRMAAMKAVTGAAPCVTPDRDRTLMRTGAESVRLSLKALAEKLSHQPGRKSVFWITQGFPVPLLRGEFENNWGKTISELNDANIAVNTVDSNGLGGPPRMWGLGGEVLTMMRLAEDTGGQAYYNRNDLDNAMISGIVKSRSTYTLGFYLASADNRFHTLKVQLDRPGVRLHYRQGYFAADEIAPDHDRKKSDLGAELLNPADSAALGMVATLDVRPGKSRKTASLKLRLDPDSLTLKKNSAGWSGKVEELFVELNSAGREVGRISAVKAFDVASEAKAAFDASGVTMVQTFPLPSEATKITIIVRDTASGRTGSLTVSLDQVISTGN